MPTRVDISIGPVQGFVAQSRRTRDLWGSSYLLSFLSAHAMRGAQEAGGRIIQPVVDADPLYRWVSDHRDGVVPQIGSVPNHFVVEVEGPGALMAANASVQGLKDAWQRVCDSVWRRYVEHAHAAGDGTEDIWNRQINSFWEVTWTSGPAGEPGALLARRKRWRSHHSPDEPGDKCTIMHDLQELSGYVRAESGRSRASQDRFWERVGQRMSRLDLRDNERLCAR
jgi:CRISPR-associated protein Cmr2